MRYVGGGASGDVLTATVMVFERYGRDAQTVDIAVTVSLAPLVSFGADTLVSVSLSSRSLGEVYTVSAAGGSGNFVYSLATPVYLADGGTVAAGLTTSVVQLGQALSAGSTVTMTVSVEDGGQGWLGEASLTLVFYRPSLPAFTGTVSVSVGAEWHTQLRLEDSTRLVARIGISGYSGVSVSVSEGHFVYEPDTADPDSGGVLRANPPPMGGSEVVTLQVSGDDERAPTRSLAYTVQWFGKNVFHFIGGLEGDTSASQGAYRLDSDTGSWTRLCSSCFNNNAQHADHRAAIHNGTIFVVPELHPLDGGYFRSTDGAAWTRFEQGHKLPHRGAFGFAFGDFVAVGGTSEWTNSQPAWPCGGATGQSYFLLFGGAFEVHFDGGDPRLFRPVGIMRGLLLMARYGLPAGEVVRCGLPRTG